jgi:hypothetical protein
MKLTKIMKQACLPARVRICLVFLSLPFSWRTQHIRSNYDDACRPCYALVLAPLAQVKAVVLLYNLVATVSSY